MLYRTLKKLVEKQGLTEDLRTKIDTLYALGRLTDAEYSDLVGE